MNNKVKYNQFIGNISNQLHSICNILNVNELVFDATEIDSIRNYFENIFNNPIGKTEELTEYKNLFCTYSGSAFIHHNGGNWELSKLKKDPSYGTPIITNYGSPGSTWVRISPRDWIWRLEKNKFRGKLSEFIIGFSPR